MRKKKTSYNWYKILLCGLVFFCDRRHSILYDCGK